LVSGKRVGVLALQGNFREHLLMLAACGVPAHPVRLPAELAASDALVLPGGESTTIGRLLEKFELLPPLRRAAEQGMPMLGTCAGMILMSRHILDGVPDQQHLDLLDITVRRNAFGRQRESFETPLQVHGVTGDPFPAVFIRSPVVEERGPEVETLAEVDGRAVAVRQGLRLGLSFHPEMTDDRRLHQLFLSWLNGVGP
jgi:5'-phosphate synthase pdxT subunit